MEQGRSPSLSRGCPSLAGRKGRGEDEDRWEGTGDVRDRGRRAGGTWGPKVQKDRKRVWDGGCVWWHLFWVFCRAGPSPGVKSCLSDHDRGDVRKGGRRRGGQGSLDKPAHTRQMFAQKNTGKSSCKYNRESACSHRWLLRLLASSVLPIRCEEGLGQVWGIGRGLLCISMRAPSPPLPRRTVLSLQMSPPKVSPKFGQSPKWV